jgi:hypothetical protein
MERRYKFYRRDDVILEAVGCPRRRKRRRAEPFAWYLELQNNR